MSYICTSCDYTTQFRRISFECLQLYFNKNTINKKVKFLFETSFVLVHSLVHQVIHIMRPCRRRLMRQSSKANLLKSPRFWRVEVGSLRDVLLLVLKCFGQLQGLGKGLQKQ
jgi:hypothetical protein